MVSFILVGRQCQQVGQLVTINLHDRAINQALVAASTLLRYLKQLFCRSEGKIDLGIAVEKAGLFPCFALVRWAEKQYTKRLVWPLLKHFVFDYFIKKLSDIA
jgi:hypothetical protein